MSLNNRLLGRSSNSIEGFMDDRAHATTSDGNAGFNCSSAAQEPPAGRGKLADIFAACCSLRGRERRRMPEGSHRWGEETVGTDSRGAGVPGKPDALGDDTKNSPPPPEQRLHGGRQELGASVGPDGVLTGIPREGMWDDVLKVRDKGPKVYAAYEGPVLVELKQEINAAFQEIPDVAAAADDGQPRGSEAAESQSRSPQAVAAAGAGGSGSSETNGILQAAPVDFFADLRDAIDVQVDDRADRAARAEGGADAGDAG